MQQYESNQAPRSFQVLRAWSFLGTFGPQSEECRLQLKEFEQAILTLQNNPLLEKILHMMLFMHCKYVWVWKVSTCDAGFRFHNKSVLHEQQKNSSFFHGESAFLMRYRHQEAVVKSVMLGHASQTSGVMQNVHDKPCILPDPDTFALDALSREPNERRNGKGKHIHRKFHPAHVQMPYLHGKTCLRS